VHLHVGTSAIEARLVLLDRDTLAPGESGLVQVVGTSPLPVRAGDRLVARDAGGERTIGGGAVIDPAAPQRFRRTPARLAALAILAEPDTALALDALLDLAPGLVDLTAFAAGRGLSRPEIEALIAEVEPVTSEVAGRIYAARVTGIDALGVEIGERLAQFHAANPERPGMAEDALRLAIPTRLAKPLMRAALAMLAPRGAIVPQGAHVRLASHTSALGANDQRLWDRLEALIGGEARFRPPQVRELAEAAGQPITAVRKLMKTMARLGAVVEVATDRFFLKPALLELGHMAEALAKANSSKTFTAAEFRDRAGSGRNVGIQILEHFDRRGLTLRQGDVRRVVKDPAVIYGDRDAG
jgi:selenocysteine-specific elongation factor